MTNNIEINYPEMWGTSDAEIQAEFSAIVNKYRVTSKKEIVIKRGITFNSIVSEFGANNIPNKRKGWFKYYMTPKAFETFTKTNKVTINCNLD